MAVTANERRRKELDAENQQPYQKFKIQTFDAGQYATLDTLDLEIGDTLPDDSTYEIISSKIQHVKGARMAVATGLLELTESTAAAAPLWNELKGSRRLMVDNVQYQEWEVRFSGATGTTKPAPGDIITAICDASTLFGSTGLDEEPEAVNVSISQRATPSKDHVTVRFRAYYEEVALTGPAVWDELRGARRLVGEGAHDRDWEIRFAGATGSTIPTNGQTYADVVGNSLTLGSSGLVGEPLIVDVHYTQKALVLRDHIVVRFRRAKTRGANPVQ